MTSLLVATDGSLAAGAALDEAIRLAAQTGADIVAITVWRALQGDYGLAHPSVAVLDDLLETERNHAEAALRDAISRGVAAGVGVRTHLATGDPAERICEYAAEIGAQLIAIGTRGHSPVTALLLGSVSDAVIRQAPCPVLVARVSHGASDRATAAEIGTTAADSASTVNQLSSSSPLTSA